MSGRDDQRTPDRVQELSREASRLLSMVPAHPEELPPPLDTSRRTAAERLHTDPDTVERDLVRLVLTIVELLRQLMERQALHRVDAGDLTEEQEERLGLTLMILHDRMQELCERYGLTMEDLNLDLGPLGTLL
ncbi:hypothetical protein JO379_000599 [Streptomyces syringium]|uniref:Gas vesicle protein K n=2 Tax=Streptomyces syringium TaxID=76729 RepID=A0ABS4XXL0_9ACTN|nr:hypothetical protein [Streptomyces syringium]